MFLRARLRLTAWYVSVLAIILVLFNVGLALIMSRVLMVTIADELQSRAAQASSAVLASGGSPVFQRTALANDPSWSEVELYASSTSGAQSANPIAGSVLPARAGIVAAMQGRSDLATIAKGSGRFLVFTLPVWRNGTNSTGDVVAVVQVARSVRSVDTAMGNLIQLQLTATLVALVLAFLAGLWLAGKVLEPIRLNLRRQKQFVGDASHELRTPVTVIRTAAEAIQRLKQPTPERIHSLAEDIVSETDQLTRLVDNLGQLARADAKQDAVEREAVDVASLMEQVAHIGALLAEHGGVRFEAPVGEASGSIKGDRERLKQLFSILLDNAVKFSPTGATVQLIAQTQDKRLLVRVVDQGAGIPEADLPRVFDRFFRAATARQHEGSGLGLAIAKVIVDQHDGKILVRSQVGHGSELVVDLPLVEVAPEPARAPVVVQNPGLK
jgi:signal transduction histidine kinase